MRLTLIKSIAVIVGFLSLSSVSVIAQEPAKTLDQLLKQVESGRYREASENKKREKYFLENRGEQESLLRAMRGEQVRQDAISVRLEKSFDENDQKLIEVEARLKDQLGSLSELFGHITSVAGDARSNFETSLVSIQYPGREVFLDELITVTSSGTELPSIDQIDKLATELQREMTEQGKIVKLAVNIPGDDGNSVEKNVVRVGVFNIVSEEGQYLQYEKGHLKELARQPAGRYTDAAKVLASSNDGVVKIGIDPTGPSGGSLLAALINTPSLKERWKQGGLVGLVITILGVFSMALAFWRIAVLLAVSNKVTSQLKSEQANDNNPLGRVLIAARSNAKADLETLELKLNEAIIKELPRLKTGESLLKIIAAIAPLLGLLGTVTGMIITFQAITIYGAGDPKAMAGGISSALVTTVLGLLVAIPTVLMHTLVSSRSKRVIQVLEEQAAGIAVLHQEAK